jgi:hypothetical protein
VDKVHDGVTGVQAGVDRIEVRFTADNASYHTHVYHTSRLSSPGEKKSLLAQVFPNRFVVPKSVRFCPSIFREILFINSLQTPV